MRPLHPTPLLALLLCAIAASAHADIGDGRNDNDPTSPPLPTGQHISPTAATGSVFQTLDPQTPGYPGLLVDSAVSLARSPDGKTLLVLTSGYNRTRGPEGKIVPAASTEHVFVFDISGPAPIQRQALAIPNSYMGLAWAQDASRFYVSGGSDDNVHVFVQWPGPTNPTWSEAAPIPLGHDGKGIGVRQKPGTAGLATMPDGRILATNIYNDSLSVLDPTTGTVLAETDLRPGLAPSVPASPADTTTDPRRPGIPGGEYPVAVATHGTRAYVASQRDREIVVLDVATTPRVLARIPVAGNPNRVLLNRAGDRLYVTADNSDTVAVIDTARMALIATVRTTAPPGLLEPGATLSGAAPNGLALAPDERTLYVTNGGTNAIAVIDLAPTPTVRGLIPTGWYPNDVALSADGRTLFAVNGKSDAGPNPENRRENGPGGANQYVLQLQHAGFLTMPVPALADLEQLTRQVAGNNHFGTPADPADTALMAALHDRIAHVIYVIRENRTYDQVLGDLPTGNGDPGLVQFGTAITPNAHRLASQFVLLDNVLCSGEVSGNGWPWSTQGRETDVGEKTMRLNYANRGAPYDVEGLNRGVNVALPTPEARIAADPTAPASPDILPGQSDVGASDGPGGAVQEGYIWNAALRAGLTVRNYGVFLDLSRYFRTDNTRIPPERNPAAIGLQVAYSTNPTLAPLTDIYFRGYDNAFPDTYRIKEWMREFDAADAAGTVPNLTLLRLMHDHLGSFDTAIDGVNTPETQVADNDLAVGLLVEHVAQSRAAANTLIIIVEDDAQSGPDHVSAQRAPAFVVGPYVKQHATVSQRYTTVNVLKTIEGILGLGPLNINDAYQRPMSALFDLGQTGWNYHAVAAPILATTHLAVPPGLDDRQKQGNNESDPTGQGPHDAAIHPIRHPAAWWAHETAGFDWTAEDRVDPDLFNHILWDGLIGTPYPDQRDGIDWRTDRAEKLRTRRPPSP